MHIQKKAPKFIGIGGKASGLALITKLLNVHPGVCGPLPNVGSFARDEEINLNEYESALALNTTHPKSGECCPDYLTSPKAAARIARTYPDAKLFVVVRNPIDRAIVEYVHAKKHLEISHNVSCAQYLTNHTSVQTNGFYSGHLSHFFSFYSPLQLHVLVFEDFVKEPLIQIQKLYDFLELDKNFIPKILLSYVPKEEEPKHPGLIKRLFKFIKSLIKKSRNKKTATPIFPPALIPLDYFSERELDIFKKTFAADASKLSALLYRDMVVEWGLETKA